MKTKFRDGEKARVPKQGRLGDQVRLSEQRPQVHEAKWKCDPPERNAARGLLRESSQRRRRRERDTKAETVVNGRRKRLLLGDHDLFYGGWRTSETGRKARKKPPVLSRAVLWFSAISS